MTGLENIKGFKTMTVTKFTSCQCLHHLHNTAELMHMHIMRQNMSASDHSLSMSQCQTDEVATKTHDEVSLQEAPFWMESAHVHCHSSQNPECKHAYKNRHMHKSDNILQHDGKYKPDDCFQITCTSRDTKNNCPRLQQTNSQ
jgi:hypothetical protein